MLICPFCTQESPADSRFCIHCGKPVREASASPTGQMNLRVLYGMVTILIVALVVPPWETPPGQPPAFLGFHFVLDPPDAGGETGVISRMLLTIELFTIAVGGIYFSWLLREK